MAGRWCSPGTLVSSTNKVDRHDITEILLKVALNTINQTNLNKDLRSHWSKGKPRCCTMVKLENNDIFVFNYIKEFVRQTQSIKISLVLLLQNYPIKTLHLLDTGAQV